MTKYDARTLGPVLAASLMPMLLCILSVSAKEPTIWSPYPGIQTVFITTGWPWWVAVSAAPVLFIMSVFSVELRQAPHYPWPLALLMGLLTLLSGIYFWLRLPLGLQHQGRIYSASMVIVNAGLLLAFWTAWALWRRRLTAGRSIGLALLACGWLFWCAFPYFGEGL